MAQLEAMIQQISTQAAPVARQVGAKAAELAAVAATKAGPAAQRAAVFTTDYGQRFAEKAQSVAAELRSQDAADGAAADGAAADAAAPEAAPAGAPADATPGEEQEPPAGSPRTPPPSSPDTASPSVDDRRPVGSRRSFGYTRPTMSVKPIVLLGDPRLRLKGETVDSFGKYLHELLDDLTDSMATPRASGSRPPSWARPCAPA